MTCSPAIAIGLRPTLADRIAEIERIRDEWAAKESRRAAFDDVEGAKLARHWRIGCDRVLARLRAEDGDWL